MENQIVTEEKPVNKNRTIIIIVVAIVLVCCCIVAAIAGFYAITTIRSEKISPTQASEAITTQEVTTQEATPLESTPQPDAGIGEPPSGSLGNDVLRRDTWNTMAPAAVGLGCNHPNGAKSTIDVLQQPDKAGTWVEKWTVACDSGKTYAFEVQYILDATGATFNIKSLP